MATTIGIGERDKFIICVAQEELCQLNGFGSKYCTGFNEKILVVGAQWSVTQLWKEANQALENHKEAIQAAKNLRKASDNFLKFFKEETK